MDLVYYWINDKELLVNGEKMTPEQAYQQFPNYKKEIYNFVNQVRRLDDRIHFSVTRQKNYLNGTNSQDLNTLDITNKINSINKKIEKIFNDLKIKELSEQKRAFVLFKYIIENSKYDENIMDEKKDMADIFIGEVNDIYKCLIENRSVCSSDASSLSLLYRKAGIKSCHITIAEYGDIPKGAHEVVRFILKGQNYICDPTLVRSSLEYGITPEVTTSIFAFKPNDFFKKLYPEKEEKFQHLPISI